jgi:cytochrome c oxidase subunit 2
MIKLLILIVVVLAVLVIVRAVRILELVNELNDEKEEITESDNKFNAWMMLIFMIVGLVLAVYVTIDYQKVLLPTSATKHGVLTDQLLKVNFYIIGIVFFITNILLFYFSFKYRHRNKAQALFYPVNHRLEFIWTIIPALVLGVIIIYGLKVWHGITKPAPKDAMVIEVYGKQFDWTVRYSGGDNTLGKSNFRLISDDNALGVDSNDAKSKDDKIARELHLPVNTPILFIFHSRDIIHSAYMPHLRTQMNCVPGMSTQFFIEPTITTTDMRQITSNEKFDYVLLCNKICGAAHYNMKMKVIVESPEDFKKWYRDQEYVFKREAASTPEPSSIQDTTAGQANVISSEKKKPLAAL